MASPQRAPRAELGDADAGDAEAGAEAGAPSAQAAAAPAAAAAGAGVEVAGFEGSLLEAIADGAVAQPPLLAFGAWVQWRAGPGRRLRTAPAIAASESALWRSTMEALHGQDWQARLRQQGPAAARSPATPAAAQPPAADDVLRLLDSPARASDAGSDATGALSDGSWGPLTDDEVLERLLKDVEPHESMRDFERRLLRARAVLTLRRQAVPEGAVEFGMRKARFLVEARAHGEGVAAALEAKLHAVLDVETDDADEDVRALMDLLAVVRGGGSARDAVAGGAPARPPQDRAPPAGPAGVGVAPAGPPAFPAFGEDLPPGLPPRGGPTEAGPAGPSLAAALQGLAGALGQRADKKSSTIQVKPHYSLPTLGDGDFDVDSFVEEFEEMVGLANDGAGMSATEMVRVLGTCLKGSRQRAYKVELQQARRSGRLSADPDEVYQSLKERLMEFKEGLLEKQQRLNAEWRTLSRGKMSALEFQATFENIVAEMELAGMGKSDRDLLLSYLALIPPSHRAEVLKDRRVYQRSGAQPEVRGVETWREAHRVLLKLEEAESSAKALVAAVGSDFAPSPGGGGGRRRRGGGGGDQEPPEVGAVGGSGGAGAEGAVKVCFQMRDSGTCARGDACRFSHDRAAIAESRRTKKDAAGPKGKGADGKKGKGSDDGGKGGLKSQLCLQFLRGACSKSEKDCKFSHSGKAAQKVVAAVYAGAAAAKAPPPSLGSAGSPGSGQGAAPAAEEAARPAASGAAPKVQAAAGGKLEWVRPCGGVFGPSYDLPQVSVVRGSPSPEGALKDLDQIPASAWTQVQEPDDGYHYLCHTHVYGLSIRTLLDGGAVFSLTWEATIVSIINSAIAEGKSPEDPDWPIAGLMHWGRDSKASSVADKGDLKIRGMVDLRLAFEGLDGTRVVRVFRLRLLRGGWDRPFLIILGAPALDAPPLGIGHRPTLQGHYLPGLGITVKRAEADAVQAKLLTISAVFSECDADKRRGEDRRAASAVGSLVWSGAACPSYPICMVGGQCPAEFGGGDTGVIVLDDSESAVPIYLSGEEGVRLELGDCALVPARASGFAAGIVGDVVANGAAAVWAAPGPWLGREQLVLVGNWDQPGVSIEVGDIVGAVIQTDGEPAGDDPSVAHVWQDWDELRDIVELEVPTDEYYAERLVYWQRKYPKAATTLLEHLLAVEGLLDVCIAAGYSMGAEKSLDRLAQPSIEALGEIVGREGSEACERHLELIKNWSVLEDVAALRRFLGTFNWIRGHFPKEVQKPLGILTQQLKKDAEWPMTSEKVAAQRAIQQLACEAIRLAVIDMVGAISKDRPLEQVADFCPYGWGGSVYQLAADRRTLNVLAMYGGCLSLAQSNWHPRRGELYAQRETRREARKDFGRLPALCWTDHAAAVKDATGEAETDSTVIRWVGEIESDGSRLMNLSGRSAALGDGPSRENEAHGKFLREQAHSLANITIEDIIGDDYRPGEGVPWGLDETPDAAALQLVAVAGAEREKGDSIALYLPDYGCERRRSAEQARAARQLQLAAPGLRLRMIPHDPPLADGAGGLCYIAPPRFPGDASGKARKQLRNDVLTAVAAVLRECAARWPKVVIGTGHGGLVAAAAAHPRVVEAALALRYAREAEGMQVAEAWVNVRAFVAIGPRAHSPSRIGFVREAFPEFGATAHGDERPAPLYLVEGAGAHRRFGQDLGEALGVKVSATLGEVLMQEVVSAPPRLLEFSGGRCACGRSSLVLARCGQCIRADRELEEEARLAEAPEEAFGQPDAVDVAASAARMRAVRPQPAVAVGPGPCIAVSAELVRDLLEFGGGRADFTCNCIRVRRAPAAGVVALEAARGFSYRLSCFVVPQGPEPGVEVALAQPCVEFGLELVTEIDVELLQAGLPKGAELVQLFACAWLLWEGGARLPALGATHVHRHCRGSAVSNGAIIKVSSYSSAYSEVFAGALGLSWYRALRDRFGGRASGAFVEFADSDFARGEREAFEVPDVLGAITNMRAPASEQACSVGRVACAPERGTAAFDAEVADGRKLEDADIAIREEYAARVRGCEPEAGSEPFELSKSLRAHIIGDQWKDEELGAVCMQLRAESGAGDTPEAQRLGEDFALEQFVTVGPGEQRWLLVLPASGGPGSGISWRRFVFLHVHAGPSGGHKTVVATRECARRLVVWPGLAADIEKWCASCWACLRFRKQTTKVQASFIVARHRLPFHHVVIDVEGRITPPDVDGHAYVLTYICVTTGAPLFEPLKHLQHSEVRRAFFRCATRAKTWPMLVSSDRGKEFCNALMEELWALLNFAGRFGTSWRPCEQADAERSHIECAREIGIFLHDVFKCAPGQWAELLPIVEFVLWNSPGKSALSPRDLCMGWSLASPLERELLPLEPAVREAVSDVAAAQFEQFRRLREVYLQHRARAGRRRAELANRTRSSRRPEVGDMVLFKDPKLSKAVAGHAPGRRPLRGPFEVLSTKGNVATLRDPETQQVLKDIHGDFLVGVPGLVDDTERIVKLEEDDGRGRASAGQLLAARLAPGGGEAAEALAPRVKARMREVKVGRLVAYQGEEAKRCRVGKVLSLAEDLSSVTVHVYQAAVDGRLQVVWTAAYDRQEGADFQRQRVETLEAKRVLGVVELNKGVLNHSAASRLARAGWRLDEGTVRHGALAAAAVAPAAPRPSDLPSSRVIALVAACRPLEELDLKIGEAVQSLGAANAVCSVVAGIDLKRRTYGQYWDLSRAKDRARLRYLLFEVLRPAGAHWALPCAKWSSLGGHQPDANAHALASFTMDGLEHLDGAGCLASFEGPRAHALVASAEWQQRFGSAEAPRGRWRYVLPDGCMFHCRSPDEEPLAMQKPYVIVGNFPLDLLDVQCRRGALRPLGRGLEGVEVASAELGGDAGSSMIGAARAPEGPRMPCEPGRAAAPAAGVTRSVDKLSDAEMAEKKARREPAAAAAKKKWAELAKKGDWDQVRMPGKCFRFAEVKVSPRRSAEYKAKVLEAVGLVGECAGYKHLGSQELEALKEMISLKAEAFWVKGTARTVMRGFKHDVVTTGLPVRGPPIRLKGPEASIVREELEAGVEQGLYSRGTSPWGSWAFPTKEHASGRRRRTVVDYRMVNRRMVMFVYYIRRCRDVKGELVGCAFISGMDGARGFNLLVNTEHAKEVLAVLADCGCYLPEVLQLGPATGPFDFQFCTDELFTGTGRGRYGSVWKNYIDDFWVRTGQWLNGRAYTDREYEEMLAAASPPPAASRPLGDSLAAAGFAGTRKASQSYDHAKGVLVGLCVAQSATGAAAMEGGGVALANGLRMLVVAAAVRTASLVDEGLRAGVQLTQDIFEAGGDLVQSVSWNLSGLIHEVCEGAVLVVRVLVVVQCCYALYCLRSWVACRSQRAALERAATAGEAAQRGLTSSARACEAGDGPAFGREPMARAAAAGRSPSGALSAADGAASPVVALWREAEFETPLLGAAARPRAEVLQIQRSAAVALRDLEHSDRQRAARARDLAACGAVVSAKLVEAARSSAVKDAGDLCEFEVEVAGSRGVRYDVRLRAGRLAAALLPASCTCADFVGGVGSPCKHIGAAWCCAVDGNFSELVELALAAGRKEGAAAGPQRRAALAPSDSLGLAGAVRELRDSEAEVVRLREEVQQLKAQLGATSRRGAVTEFLSASETLAAWARACGEAESYVYVACFTFDQPGVVNYLEAARARGLTVRLVFSGRDKALTNNQGPRLQRLRACGCEVRAHKGSRLHAKVMMTEREIVLGSCNFTTASLGNVERGASLQELSEETVLEQKEWFEQLFEAASPFKDGIGEALEAGWARGLAAVALRREALEAGWARGLAAVAPRREALKAGWARGLAAVAPRCEALEARRARGLAAAARGAGGHLGERPSGRGAEMAGARHFAAPSTPGSAGSYERLHGAEFGDFKEFIDFNFVERHVAEDWCPARGEGHVRSGMGAQAAECGPATTAPGPRGPIGPEGGTWRPLSRP
ncbi:unnamed protein product [Prorocentrum cordatum]|uniref:Uncharacterized protein n=1 Tax=Prorocentrum cordatum TaxID=2364126 RepID=A0ABN9ST76_9DINO|nr:unnamed protein product [Polarella glacialis]